MNSMQIQVIISNEIIHTSPTVPSLSIFDELSLSPCNDDEHIEIDSPLKVPKSISLDIQAIEYQI